MLSHKMAKNLCDALLLHGANFKRQAPFPHAIIDDFLPVEMYQKALNDFPPTSLENYWERSNTKGIEVKMRSKWDSELDIPGAIRELASFFNGGLFLRALSELTDIPSLISDPYYTGGGLNISLPGGHLDVHVDGNYHDAMDVHRRLNLLLYFNDNWSDDWGGHLSLYDSAGEKEVQRIAPIANRLVVFETHDKTYHGHPEPLKCPEGHSRKSLILYYYTSAKRSEDQVIVEEPHSALWRSQNWHDKRGNKTRNIIKS